MQIVPLDVYKLIPGKRKAYHNLVGKSLWPCLKGKDPWNVSNSVIIAAIALVDKKPIGIALATYRIHMRHAKLLWLYAKPQFRVEAMPLLIDSIENQLQKQFCEQLSFLYQTDLPTTPALEALLHERGWHKPQLTLVRCHFPALEFNPPWLNKPYVLPADFQLFPWSDLTAKEREQIHSYIFQGRVSVNVSPFHDEKTIDPNISIGMRKDGVVIGWSITNRIAPDTIKYSSLYIDSEYRHTGYSIIMLIESMRRHQQTTIDKAVLDVNLHEADFSWINFIKKRLVPSCSRIERFKQTFHQFEPETSDLEYLETLFEGNDE